MEIVWMDKSEVSLIKIIWCNINTNDGQVHEDDGIARFHEIARIQSTPLNASFI